MRPKLLIRLFIAAVVLAFAGIFIECKRQNDLATFANARHATATDDSYASNNDFIFSGAISKYLFFAVGK